MNRDKNYEEMFSMNDDETEFEGGSTNQPKATETKASKIKNSVTTTGATR